MTMSYDRLTQLTIIHIVYTPTERNPLSRVQAVKSMSHTESKALAMRSLIYRASFDV